MNAPAPDASRALTGTPEELLASCRADMDTARREADRFTGLPGEAPRGDALRAFDDAFAALSDAAARASLARNVHPDARLREAAERCEQEVDALATALSLDRRLYDALAAVDLAGADAVDRWFVEKSLRDFRRAGVDKDEATRARVKALREELVRIGQEFGRNIREDVRRASFAPDELAGLPGDWLRARPPGADGKIAVTTDNVDYVPVVTYAARESTRETMWRLYRLRAPQNLEVLATLLERRAELARLLGHPTWAAYATEDKMIGSADAAAAFVERVAAASEGRMRRDAAQMLERKRRDDPAATRVFPWDATYLQERVKAERYGFESQAVRPYFEYERVKQGVLDVTGRLLGVRWKRVEDAPVWHPDVEVYDVLDAADGRLGALLGRIYLDMHPRDGKYKHYAQFTVANGTAGRRLPEGALVCNFPRPGKEPALLEHSEVKTFFHEFGHLLHHVLGGHTRWAAHAGVATEWDFVEAPSQLLEEWTWDPDVLATFARHHQTGEPLPRDLALRMKAADEYGKGFQVRQQMFYAALSLELHRRDPAGLDSTALADELMARYTPFEPVAGTHFHSSFGHLEGYSAIYYTYMWSLVIAKDLFGEFERAGLMDPATARRYRSAVLEAGGSKPAAELVEDFLGRPSGFEAWTRWIEREVPGASGTPAAAGAQVGGGVR
jgi:thimet oligopeptidase